MFPQVRNGFLIASGILVVIGVLLLILAPAQKSVTEKASAIAA